MILSVNRSIATLPNLNTFLADHPDAVVGWGRKTSGRRAILLARILHRPFVLLEDGFIRSVQRGSPTLSVIVDDIGVYYDAGAPARVEQVIAAGAEDTQAVRARGLISSWRAANISKYNHAPEHVGDLPSHYVLVIDQTYGDLSVGRGLADEITFAKMLDAALAENPDHDVLVKVHPDVLTHRKRGYFGSEALTHPRIHVIADGSHPVRLVRHAAAVYVVTSLIGFEALLWNRPIRCFGMPFYAGWGLTHDELAAPSRRGAAQLEDIVHAAFVAQARYVNPANGSVWQIEQAIAYVAAQRAALFGALAQP